MLRAVFASALVMTSIGCAQLPQHARSEDAIFQALGGHQGVERVVDGFLLLLVEDARLAAHFADVDVLRFRSKLIEQLCVEAGGPCVYTGDSMRDSHAGRGISRADFNAVVEVLQRSMQQQAVPYKIQNRLLQRLAPMHRDIVER